MVSVRCGNIACPGAHSTIRITVPWPLPTKLYFLTKPARCAASASIELSTGMEFVDQISQPEMLGPRPRDTAFIFSSETTIPLPNSSCPVTILLTSSVMITSPVRFDRTYGLSATDPQAPPAKLLPVERSHPPAVTSCLHRSGNRPLGHTPPWPAPSGQSWGLSALR